MSTTPAESPPKERRSSRARLRDVAREAGVSVATASRALRGEACVREEMADRVHRAATAVGYARPRRDGTRQRAASGRAGGKRAGGRALVLTPTANTEALTVPKLLEGIALTLRGAALDPVFTENPADLPSPLPRGAIAIHITNTTARAALNSKARIVNVGHAPGGKVDAVVADDLAIEPAGIGKTAQYKDLFVSDEVAAKVRAEEAKPTCRCGKCPPDDPNDPEPMI